MPHVPRVQLPVPALHTSDYRNPDGLPPGAVLVVGAGPSGQQIARELAAAGRPVHLAVGGHKALPRRYRGRDTYWWMDRLGMLSRSVDTLPGGRAAAPEPQRRAGGRHPGPGRAVAGRPGRRGARSGSLDVRDGVARFGDDLDGHARGRRTPTPTGSAPPSTPTWPPTGFAVPVEAPRPARPGRRGPARAGPGRHRRGGLGHRVPPRLLLALGARAGRRRASPSTSTASPPRPGLYFLGLRWQSRRSSSFLDGVAADAEHVTAHLAARTSFATAA